MIITVKDKKYILHFAYSKNVARPCVTGHEGIKDRMMFTDRVKTTCIIKDFYTKEVYTESSVTQDSRERFIKNRGRKFSITKALKNMTFDKAERREFWRGYFKQINENFSE